MHADLLGKSTSANFCALFQIFLYLVHFSLIASSLLLSSGEVMAYAEDPL